MSSWIVPCKSNCQEINDAFLRDKYLKMRQPNCVAINDQVYLYANFGHQHYAVFCKCKVIAVDINTPSEKDNIVAALRFASENSMMLDLIEKYSEDLFPLSRLRGHGLQAIKMDPILVDDSLQKVLDSHLSLKLVIQEHDGPEEFAHILIRHFASHVNYLDYHSFDEYRKQWMWRCPNSHIPEIELHRIWDEAIYATRVLGKQNLRVVLPHDTTVVRSNHKTQRTVSKSICNDTQSHSRIDAGRITVGSSIRHKLYGVGKIIDITGNEGVYRTVSVAFDSGKTRRFLLNILLDQKMIELIGD